MTQVGPKVGQFYSCMEQSKMHGGSPMPTLSESKSLRMSEPLLTIYKEAQRASRQRLWSWPALRVDYAVTGPRVSSECHP